MTISLSDVERAIRQQNVLGANIHFDGRVFRVHVRQSVNTGFLCAQQSHDTLAGALAEHFTADGDLSDLLD